MPSCVLLACAAAMSEVARANRGVKPPSEWLEQISRGDMLFASNPTDPSIMPSVENGFIGGDVGCVGGAGGSAGVLHIAGVYGGYSPSQRYEVSRATFPNPLAVTFQASSTAASPQNVSLNYAGAALDMAGAAFLARWELPACGPGAILQYITYAHRLHRSAMIMQLDAINVTKLCNVAVSSCSGRPGLVTQLDSVRYQVTYPEQPANTSWPRRVPEVVAISASSLPDLLTFKPDDPGPKLFVAAARTTLEPDVTNSTCAALAAAEVAARMADGPDVLWKSHIRAWQDAYGLSSAAAGGGIEIMGNRSLAAKINSSYYYLLSSVRADWPHGISEGGIASQSYNAHMFWSDGVMDGPLFAAINRPIATALMEYRAQRLAAAKSIARMNNLSGAYWPWQSAATGFEQSCGNQSVAMIMDSNPRIGCYWMHEIHVSADVALYFRLNYRQNGNKTFLRETAWPIVSATADFFSSRATRTTSGTKNWTMLNVIGPDEHSYIQNSNTYTNYVAGQTMEFAAYIANDLGIDWPTANEWREKSQQMFIPLQTMCINFQNASTNCPVSEQRTIHPQYDGYHGQDINQADVVLMQWPFHAKLDPVVAAADLEYYASRTSGSDTKGFYTGDSSYAIAYLFHGQREQAAEQFYLAFRHMIGDFNIWTELDPQVAHSDGHLNFITGAGGFLENIVFGYGGVFYDSDCLRLNPSLPPLGVESLVLRGLSYREGSIRLLVNATHVTLSRMSGSQLVIQNSAGDKIPMAVYPSTTTLSAGRITILG